MYSLSNKYFIINHGAKIRINFETAKEMGENNDYLINGAVLHKVRAYSGWGCAMALTAERRDLRTLE